MSCHHYFVTFIDDATKCTWVYLMKPKDKFLREFKAYHKMIETKFDRKIKVFRLDNGDEYTAKEFQAYLPRNGIELQTLCAYTPEQNGVAKQKNRHMLELARALLIEMNVPKSFWSDGVLTKLFLINRMPSKILGGKSPMEVPYVKCTNVSSPT